MKALIVYDSFFSNTRKIAEAIGSGFEEEVISIIPVQEAGHFSLREFSLLIVGSPTRGFRATPSIMKWLKSIPARGLNDIHTVAFDTRIELSSIQSSALRFMVDKGGYAAGRIEKWLIRKGGIMLVPPEGFLVTGTEGPLAPDELERAQIWGKAIQGLCLNLRNTLQGL